MPASTAPAPSFPRLTEAAVAPGMSGSNMSAKASIVDSLGRSKHRAWQRPPQRTLKLNRNAKEIDHDRKRGPASGISFPDPAESSVPHQVRRHAAIQFPRSQPNALDDCCRTHHSTHSATIRAAARWGRQRPQPFGQFTCFFWDGRSNLRPVPAVFGAPWPAKTAPVPPYPGNGEYEYEWS